MIITRILRMFGQIGDLRLTQPHLFPRISRLVYDDRPNFLDMPTWFKNGHQGDCCELPMDYYFPDECYECGYSLRLPDPYDTYYTYKETKWNYCPNCGTSIIDHGSDPRVAPCCDADNY